MLTGRDEEQKKLLNLYHSNEAEFAAIWGRRRVGKTYLVKQTFKTQNGYYLQIMGEKGGSLSSQLANFIKAVSLSFYPKGVTLEAPKSWKHAFEILTSTIKEVCKEQKVVLFFDELPWLAGGKSKILFAIDYYWNNYWCDMPNVKLVVCGSAASWMIDKIVSNKGGLHNRINLKIRLEPFSLKQTHEFLTKQGHQYTLEQTLQVYLTVGGIPFYLKLFSNKYSITQNINQLCFTSSGILFKEFDELYSSLFKTPAIYEEIVRELAKHPQGLARIRLIEKLKLSSDGGGFNRRLKALTESGFISKQIIFFNNKNEDRYKLTDEYTIFYFQWIQAEKNSIAMLGELKQHWQTISKSPTYNAWRGLTFERFCYKHLQPILTALRLQSIKAIGQWQAPGAQIDLYIDRKDDAVTLCEIKYTNETFCIGKKYAEELRNKINVFRETTKTKKQIVLCIISVNGLQENKYKKELIAWDVSLDDFV